MTNAHNPSGPATQRPMNLVPVHVTGRARRGREATGGAWRPSAPFVAQMVGERAEGNKLSRARSNVNTILSAYGEAALLKPRTPQQLDCSA